MLENSRKKMWRIWHFKNQYKVGAEKSMEFVKQNLSSVSHLNKKKQNSQLTIQVKNQVCIHTQTPTTYTYLHSPVENILIRVDGTVVQHGSIQAHFLIVLILPQNSDQTKVATNVVFD